MSKAIELLLRLLLSTHRGPEPAWMHEVTRAERNQCFEAEIAEGCAHRIHGERVPHDHDEDDHEWDEFDHSTDECEDY